MKAGQIIAHRIDGALARIINIESNESVWVTDVADDGNPVSCQLNFGKGTLRIYPIVLNDWKLVRKRNRGTDRS